MTSSTVALNEARLREILTGPTGAAYRLVATLSRRVMNNARQRAPVDTGNLKRSIHTDRITTRGRTIAGGVTAATNYAYELHEGRAARFIKPVNAKALSWIDKSTGKRVFSAGHHVRGTRPRPYLIDALREEAPRLGFDITK